ncbi:MAG: ATP synthase F1 subunit delta [Phycisphaerales bacterium]|nr:ATP synthase F1 subunit delta [Phycisphaerales bacterium]
MASEFDIAQSAASVYAESLLELANEAKQAEEIAQELSGLRALWDQEPAFSGMMSSAAIDDDARRESLKRAFGSGRVSPLVLNLMLVLNEKRRSMILPLVCDAFRHKLDAQIGREEVFVTTASPLEDPQREKIRDEVKRLTGQDAILVEKVDPEVLGSLKIQVGDRLYDMTLRRRLRDLRSGLLASTEDHLRSGMDRFVTEAS